MNKYEIKRIQTAIESIEFEIQCVIDSKKDYKEDAKMMSYFQGKERGYKNALETFKLILNEWNITPDHQGHHSNSDPKIH